MTRNRKGITITYKKENRNPEYFTMEEIKEKQVILEDVCFTN